MMAAFREQRSNVRPCSGCLLVFDRNNVTFVSVTQSFNTTTSMGRLTLNILLSFAQFEREVIGERIRDKFRASRSRGMWMGGHPPLGYDVKNRKLVVNEPEAALVRSIFERFVRVGSATKSRNAGNGGSSRDRRNSAMSAAISQSRRVESHLLSCELGLKARPSK
jgi:DNA invertase Pin-like site-specific DNA recombinase